MILINRLPRKGGIGQNWDFMRKFGHFAQSILELIFVQPSASLRRLNRRLQQAGRIGFHDAAAGRRSMSQFRLNLGLQYQRDCPQDDSRFLS